MKYYLFAAALFPALADAHPHGTVEQQLHLSLGRDMAELTWIIVPPAEQAGHLLAHLDLDGDSALDEAERAAFAQALVDATLLSVNGEEVALAESEAIVPDATAISQDAGRLEMTARSNLVLPTESFATLSVEVSYSEFSEDWFIQPFYFENLADGASPRIERAPNALTVSIPAVAR
ncbi:hypothetical protein [Salipiger mucosus]|nr:hypothetical protein [Salipiger mucosus]